MNQKDAKIVRDGAYQAMQTIEFEGFTPYGIIQDGAVFEKDGSFVVIKAVVKKETFADEVDELMEDLVKKEADRAEKAKAKAAKDKE